MGQDITIDFYSDWIDFLKNRLIKAGYIIDETDRPIDIAVKHFNVEKRQLTMNPREVFISKEFSCPAENENAVKHLTRVVTNGINLIPYLSKSILAADYYDSLLDDWGIHHFHLGDEPDKKNPAFVSRTKPLLFAWVEEDKFFMIDVMQHGSWANRKLIEIIHANWPELIEKFKIQGISPSPPLTQNQTKNLRSKNCSTMISFSNGDVYAPFGGGTMASGASLNAIIDHDRREAELKDIEQSIRNNIDELIEAAAQDGITVQGALTFRLIIENGALFALEENHGVRFSLNFR